VGIWAKSKSSLRDIRRGAAVVGLVLLISSSHVLAQAFGPSQILAHASSYDGKHVTVSGTVRHVLPDTSQQGKDYVTFQLCDNERATFQTYDKERAMFQVHDNECMNIFVWGHPKLREGQRQSFSGTFDTVKRVEPHTFENVLEVRQGSVR
jgi:hypothetical protein